MATRINDLPVEVSAGDLETRYVELGDMAIRHARVPAGRTHGHDGERGGLRGGRPGGSHAGVPRPRAGEVRLSRRRP